MLYYFSKFELVFAVSVIFHEQVLFLVHIFCWKNEYILDIISRIWVQSVKKKIEYSFFRDIFDDGK